MTDVSPDAPAEVPFEVTEEPFTAAVFVIVLKSVFGVVAESFIALLHLMFEGGFQM